MYYFSLLMYNELDHIPKLQGKIAKKLGFHELQTINLRTRVYKFTHITKN